MDIKTWATEQIIRWAYERLVAWAEEADLRVRSIDSPLPQRPARQEAEALLMSLNRRGLVLLPYFTKCPFCG
jgi:hypothetical protein